MRYRVPYFEPGAPELTIEQHFFPPRVRLLMNSLAPPSRHDQRIFQFPMPRHQWRTLTVLPRGWDGSLVVLIDDCPVWVVRPLRWHEIALVGLPLLTAWFGHAGVVLGLIAFTINALIIRCNRPLSVRAFVCVLSFLGAATNRLVIADTVPPEVAPSATIDQYHVASSTKPDVTWR